MKSITVFRFPPYAYGTYLLSVARARRARRVHFSAVFWLEVQVEGLKYMYVATDHALYGTLTAFIRCFSPFWCLFLDIGCIWLWLADRKICGMESI